jgi:hypothetical protein
MVPGVQHLHCGGRQTVRSSADGWVQVPTTYNFACTVFAAFTLPNVNIPLPAGTKVTISLYDANRNIGYITGGSTTTVRTILPSPLVEEFPRGGGDLGGVPQQVGFFPPLRRPLAGACE